MLIAVTQRVLLDKQFGYRRDALNQSWFKFLRLAKLQPLIIPNEINTALDMINNFSPQGLLLTGGNNLKAYSGDAPERDQLEIQLILWAINNHLPILGICRGMQLIQHYFDIKLKPILHHICDQQTILFNGQQQIVNSYHRFGATETSPELKVLATSKDGIIKAVQHKSLPIFGIMWHPERINPFRSWDIEYVKQIFNKSNVCVEPLS